MYSSQLYLLDVLVFVKKGILPMQKRSILTRNHLEEVEVVKVEEESLTTRIRKVSYKLMPQSLVVMHLEQLHDGQKVLGKSSLNAL